MRKLQWFENFSDEELEKIEKNVDGYYSTRNLAACLRLAMKERAEREKNPGVWDGAPEWADRVRLEWNASGGRFATTFQTYTRTLPKTKAREIAERKADRAIMYTGLVNMNRQKLEDLLESAINEALEGEK